ncbi:hypothetical protein [Dyadobacter psychrotolerans]|uniref:Uncharacterized protein n=1 Tax=Dyadobacter psychrotolerans TaxID=2541721 RepID=A0A4R5E1X1_9BACT|nr:hypothetical protein [Dyadobacter psychrotolerans]TDE18145.1 hypothetical protein E0F88_00945 [Dyadobacter psychrotolerans]
MKIVYLLAVILLGNMIGSIKQFLPEKAFPEPVQISPDRTFFSNLSPNKNEDTLTQSVTFFKAQK